jgi:hypothetical protein
MFYVDLEPADNNKEIYNLRFLNNLVIKVEPPHKTTNMVQCTRCQQYNHTKACCNLPYKCVKCGKPHDSKTCVNPKIHLQNVLYVVVRIQQTIEDVKCIWNYKIKSDTKH